MENKLVEVLNELKDNEEALSMLFVSLISSDTLLTKKDCEKSIKYLEELKEAVPLSELPEKKKKEYIDFCDKGVEICKRDYDQLGGI